MFVILSIFILQNKNNAVFKNDEGLLIFFILT